MLDVSTEAYWNSVEVKGVKRFKCFSQIGLFLLGLLTGIIFSSQLTGRVRAESQAAPEQQSPRVVTLQSYSTSGAMGANVLLAHNLQADIAVVNGYDIMKINQEILTYLAKQPGADRKALADIVSKSRAEEIFQLPKSPGAIK